MWRKERLKFTTCKQSKIGTRIIFKVSLLFLPLLNFNFKNDLNCFVFALDWMVLSVGTESWT